MSHLIDLVYSMFDPEYDFSNGSACFYPTVIGGMVYFCDGRILFELPYNDETIPSVVKQDGVNWWLHREGRPSEKVKPINFPSKLECIDFTPTHDVPDIDLGKGLNMRCERLETCDECDGCGTVECNYGHEHECP